MSAKWLSDGITKKSKTRASKSHAGVQLVLPRILYGRLSQAHPALRQAPEKGSEMTALQNIERAKGAAAERKWIAAEVRELLKLYRGDLILKVLLDKIRVRENASHD